MQRKLELERLDEEERIAYEKKVAEIIYAEQEEKKRVAELIQESKKKLAPKLVKRQIKLAKKPIEDYNE